MKRQRRVYSHNRLARRIREANAPLLDHLHELLPDGLFVEGPDGFVTDDSPRHGMRATDSESQQALVADYGVNFYIDLYGDIPAQAIENLRTRIKAHQDAIRRIRAAGKRGELVAVPVAKTRKAVPQ